MQIEVQVGGVSLKGLCDTGATASFISKVLAEDLVMRKRAKKIGTKFIKLSTAAGRSHEYLDVLASRINVKGARNLLDQEFLVLPSLSQGNHELVLGIDFLKEANTVIELSSHGVKLRFLNFKDVRGGFVECDLGEEGGAELLMVDSFDVFEHCMEEYYGITFPGAKKKNLALTVWYI